MAIPRFFKISISTCAILLCMSIHEIAHASPHVSILQYHHVSDTTPDITSITPEKFAEHLKYLAEFHTVVSLEDVEEAIKQNNTLPDYAVAITFDDGYKNILENAHPLLKQHGYAYTIFINPAQIGSSSSQLNWEEVEQMSKEGVTFANHTVDHAHLLEKQPNESQQEWLDRVKRDVEMAEMIIEQQVGYSRKWLAYPFGEFDNPLKEMLADMGYLAFGQHSGAASWYVDLQALPRFPASGRYADLNSLKTKLRSLAMPVIKKSPDDPKIELNTNSVNVSLLVDTQDFLVDRFACYYLGEKMNITSKAISKAQAPSHRLINENTIVHSFGFTIERKFNAGRSRVNCTAPSLTKGGRFYWYSLPFFTSTAQGKYPD